MITKPVIVAGGVRTLSAAHRRPSHADLVGRSGPGGARITVAVIARLPEAAGIGQREYLDAFR